MSNEVVIKVDLDTGGVQSGAKTIKGTLDGLEGQSERISGKTIGMWSAVGNVVGNLVTQGFSAVAGAMDKAIAREDTLKNFPKVMQSLGYETGVADKAINSIKDHLDGLPSSTQAIASFVQQLTATTGDLEKSTKLGLAFNDMMLAGGASTEKISNAQKMFNSMLASGKPDMEKWLSLVETAPGQMDQLAKSMLGAEANQNDLREAIKDGKVGFDDLTDAIIRLDSEGGDGIANFEEQARAATGGIGTALENVQNRIAAAIAKILDSIGQENISGFIDSISSQFSKVADFVIEIIDSIKEAFDFDAAAAAWGKVVQAFAGSSGGIQSVAKAIGHAIGEIANVFVRIVDAIAPFLPIAAKVATVLLLVHRPAQMIAGAMPKVATGIASAATAMSGMVASGGKADKALGKVFDAAGKLGGVAAGALTGGIMAAVAAITIIIDIVAQAIEKQKAYEKATDGVVKASRLLGDESLQTVGKIGDVVTGLGDAARAAQGSAGEIRTAALSLDEVIERQGELADTMTEKFRGTEETNATVGLLAEKIAGLAGSCEGSNEKLAELQGYLSTYNELTGENITITDNFTGALSVSTDELLENAEAFKQRARAAAAQEVLIEAYKEQFEVERSIEAQHQKVEEAQRQLDEAMANHSPYVQSYADAVDWEQKKENELIATHEANEEVIGNITDKLVECTARTNEYEKQGIAKAIEANAEMADALKGLGFDLSDVGDHFANLGYTAEEAANLTTDQAVALAQAWDKPIEEIVGMCNDMGIEVPKSLQGAMSAADAIMANGGSEATASWVRSMTAGEYRMVAEAAAASGKSVDQFVIGASKIGVSGKDAVVQYAQGILSGNGDAANAASSVRSAAEGNIKGGDFWAWGNDAGKAYALGLKAAESDVGAASGALAGIAAANLHHSVPDEGPLRNGGKGEKPWGKEMVENWTEGIYAALPGVKEAMRQVASAPVSWFMSPQQHGNQIVSGGGSKSVRNINVGVTLNYAAGDDARQMARDVASELNALMYTEA